MTETAVTLERKRSVPFDKLMEQIGEGGMGTVFVESGIPEATIAELARRGHKVERGNSFFGGYQAVRIDWQQGVLHGGTESRSDGAAVGY